MGHSSSVLNSPLDLHDVRWVALLPSTFGALCPSGSRLLEIWSFHQYPFLWNQAEVARSRFAAGFGCHGPDCLGGWLAAGLPTDWPQAGLAGWLDWSRQLAAGLAGPVGQFAPPDFAARQLAAGLAGPDLGQLASPDFAGLRQFPIGLHLLILSKLVPARCASPLANGSTDSPGSSRARVASLLPWPLVQIPKLVLARF